MEFHSTVLFTGAITGFAIATVRLYFYLTTKTMKLKDLRIGQHFTFVDDETQTVYIVEEKVPHLVYGNSKATIACTPVKFAETLQKEVTVTLPDSSIKPEAKRILPGQTILAEERATITIDNSRGSTRYFTITDSNRGVYEPLAIEFDPRTGKLEIDGQQLSSNQRKLFIEFLQQKD